MLYSLSGHRDNKSIVNKLAEKQILMVLSIDERSSIRHGSLTRSKLSTRVSKSKVQVELEPT